MGHNVLSSTAYTAVRQNVTRGGTTSATHVAEERARSGRGLDVMVDPKGPPHLGPVRRSLPRFESVGAFWRLTRGIPMDIERLLDTTGSMGGNVEMAFNSLPQDYALLTEGDSPILGDYDPQIATAIFNDVEDPERVARLARSQFEMAEKIALQMACLPPGKGGCNNGKEDPQFGLFAAAYLTDAALNRWGLKGYHFTVSDEPIVEHIDMYWLRRIFGDDVLERAKENGHNFAEGLPRTDQVVRDLQKRTHAFFLQVDNRHDVTQQWIRLYGREHVVFLPGGSTRHLHYVSATIIGLTEGVLDLSSARDFLVAHGLDARTASQVIRAVEHIPLGAQMQAENYGKLPKAGDYFQSKTDLWPVDPDVVSLAAAEEADDQMGPNWL